MNKILHLFLPILLCSASAYAMEAPPQGPSAAATKPWAPKKNPLPHSLANKYTQKADDAITLKNITNLEGLLLEIEAANRLFEVIGDPDFFLQLYQRVKQALWTLKSGNSNKLIDSHDGASKKPEEKDETTAKDPLLTTVLLLKTAKNIEPKDPNAHKVAQSLEEKRIEKQALREEAEARRAELLTAARRAAAEIENLRQQELELDGTYIHVAQTNPDAASPVVIEIIRTREADAAQAKANRSWWDMLAAWKFW